MMSALLATASLRSRQPLTRLTSVARSPIGGCVRPDRAAATCRPAVRNADHPCDQPVGAAARPPDAAVLLQLVDQRVDRRRGHRIAADEQGVEREAPRAAARPSHSSTPSNRPTATPGISSAPVPP
jgi:hypothetical protein